jgi:hypothetical protein
MKIFIDTEKKTIEITSDSSELAAPNFEVFFSATKNVTFNSVFRFGYNLLDGKTSVATGSYPVGDTKFVSTDQDHLVSERIDILEPNKSYEILVWTIHGTDYFEKLSTFDVSNLGQPFPSWTFDVDSHVWVAPKPRPENGWRYFWDEATGSWKDKATKIPAES